MEERQKLRHNLNNKGLSSQTLNHREFKFCSSIVSRRAKSYRKQRAISLKACKDVCC